LKAKGPEQRALGAVGNEPALVEIKTDMNALRVVVVIDMRSHNEEPL
jgi:hypothetical protein